MVDARVDKGIYLLCTVFLRLNQVKTFALHKPEHVEEAIVA